LQRSDQVIRPVTGLKSQVPRPVPSTAMRSRSWLSWSASSACRRSVTSVAMVTRKRRRPSGSRPGSPAVNVQMRLSPSRVRITSSVSVPPVPPSKERRMRSWTCSAAGP
jgi:hypothetical protein